MFGWRHFCLSALAIFLLTVPLARAPLTHVLTRGKQLYCGFIDFSNAFDYVIRDNLWYKLTNLCVRGEILSVMQFMHENAKYFVKVNGHLRCYSLLRLRAPFPRNGALIMYCTLIAINIPYLLVSGILVLQVQ